MKKTNVKSPGKRFVNVFVYCLGVVSVAAHPSGHFAASASLDSFVRVFDVDTNNTIASLEAPPSEVWQMQYDPRVHEQLKLLSSFFFSFFFSFQTYLMNTLLSVVVGNDEQSTKIKKTKKKRRRNRLGGDDVGARRGRRGR